MHVAQFAVAASVIHDSSGVGYDTLWRFVGECARHVWKGLDHVLFLVTLRLPVALVWRAGGWRPAERGGAVVLGAATLVTVFTLTAQWPPWVALSHFKGP